MMTCNHKLRRGIDPLALKVGDHVRFKSLMVLVAFAPNWIVGTGTVERIKFGHVYFKCRRGHFCIPIDEPAWAEAKGLQVEQSRADLSKAELSPAEQS